MIASEPYTTVSHILPFELPAYMIADTHFLHRNIAKYEPMRQALGYDHNQFMVDQWRATVADDDVIVHLGDLALGRSDDFQEIAAQLTGRKFLVRGNHDKRTVSWYARHGFEVIPPFWIEYRDWSVRFTHEPDHEVVRAAQHLNVHGHIHSVELPNRRLINLSAEAINFRPVPIIEVLDARIAEFA